ncbi:MULTISPECIES: serine hydrolase [unclassified Rhodococcus (in: high G+C Gram-positive bacteria)]|uniref:serine hydrolase domain-containing protein n=1 Tax=Rhodococcus sp. SJ-3 TaxID=3454628 RepID=UPI003F7A07C7
MTIDLHYPPRISRPLMNFVSAMTIVVLSVACSTSPPAAHTDAPPASVTRPVAPEDSLADPLRTALQDALDRTVTEYGVPGAAVGVWLPDEGAWTAVVGAADIEDDVAVTTEMTWPLRSITKSYTVTLILQLVDEGVIGLDDTIGRYVGGVTGGDTITLRELAGMSSGNADYTGERFVEVFSEDPSKIFTLDELNGFVLGQPAQFAPGAEKVYTNANTNLLGAVVEKVTGRQFADVLDERILGPLGLTNTAYVVDASLWADPHPVGYAQGAGELEEQPDNLSIFGPAGSMISTLDDGRVWGEVLATGTLLQPETQAERQEGAPLDEGPPYDIYALGIGETAGWWGHNGEGLGFTAALFHNPESGATVVVFMNESDIVPKAHPADQLFRRIAEILGSER